MYNENPDVFEEITGQSATAQICVNMELYGAAPADGETDSRDLPDLDHAKALIENGFQMWQEAFSDSSLENEMQDLLWNMVNVYQRKIQKLDKGFDGLSYEIRRSMQEQDGSEIKSHELETLQTRAHATTAALDFFEALRDHAAECYYIITNHPWTPTYGSRTSRNGGAMTSAVIDSRDFMAAERKRKNESLLPQGTRVAIAGGHDYADYKVIYSALDKVYAKYPDMVLLHGGADKGVDKIAACWAESKKINQVAFKPNWNRYKKRAGFMRNDEIIAANPIGLLIFPGSGVTENLADKAKKAGITVKRYP